eukprot:Hpha_TRINITY_DN17316_c0_g1::TRINITY_DN17316_c0_g1_i1::g.137973::m.137973
MRTRGAVAVLRARRWGRSLHQADFVPETACLSGSCPCGKAGFEATGESAMNVTTHAVIAQRAAGASYLNAACFSPANISWRGAPSREGLGPSATAIRCGCDKGLLMGIDESKTTGTVMLDLSRTAQPVPDRYLPLCHVWYGERADGVDVSDDLIKWEGLMG